MLALFLTWDGPHQSYLESLFLPIFVGLRRFDVHVHVLQFTWATAEQLAPTRAAAERLGVAYRSQRTSRRFGLLGNVAAIARGAGIAAADARRLGADVLFPRSLLPASMALLARRRLPGVGLVFDADGLMADERVDFGGWNPRGAPYRVLRSVEARSVQSAVSVVTRTRAAKRILLERAGAGVEADKIFVVPNAKDAAVITPGTAESRSETRRRYGVGEATPWVVYAGSIGPQYQPERMFDLFGAILKRAPAARFQVFTFHEDQLRNAMRARAVPESAVRITHAMPEEIASSLAAADLGLALRSEAFSQQAVCPIKVAEYLLAGVPVVSTKVGDLAEQLGAANVGRLLDSVSDGALEAAAKWFVTEVMPKREDFRTRAREVGTRVFGLESCVEAYGAAFARARRGSG